MIKTINQDFKVMDEKHSKAQKKLSFFIIILLGVLFSTLWMLFDPGLAYAAQFDVDKAGTALFRPILTFIDKWAPAGIFGSGVGGMLMTPGDLKVRAGGFAVGAGLAGVSLWAVKEGFGI